MKFFRQAVVLVILFAAFSVTGSAAENSSPSLDSILQRVIASAKLEGNNDRNFDQLYSYSRAKVTEFRNSSGDLKKREDKTGVHQPNPAATVAPPVVAATGTQPQQNQPASDTHSNVHGQTFKKNDFLFNEDLAKRFTFTLAGTDIINGRRTFMIDFVPAKKDLPERNLKDRFINKAAGRVWVDAQDYTLVKAALHLTKQVDVALGLVGAVWKFNYNFDRARTPDGFWFTRDVNWHLEGREVVVDRTVDYHETTANVQKISAVATR